MQAQNANGRYEKFFKQVFRKRKEVSQFANTSTPFNSLYFFLTQSMLKSKVFELFGFLLKITAHKVIFVQ